MQDSERRKTVRAAADEYKAYERMRDPLHMSLVSSGVAPSVAKGVTCPGSSCQTRSKSRSKVPSLWGTPPNRAGGRAFGEYNAN